MFCAWICHFLFIHPLLTLGRSLLPVAVRGLLRVCGSTSPSSPFRIRVCAGVELLGPVVTLESCSAVSTAAVPVYVWPRQEARPSRPRRHPPFPLLKTGGRSGVAGGVCLAPVPSFSID